MFAPNGLLEFLKGLFNALKIPILIFAIGVIVVLSVFGSNIPSSYQVLVYIITIGALIGAIFFTRKDTKIMPTPQLSPENNGAILYVNVKGYSLLRDADQERIVKKLQDELNQYLGTGARNIFEPGGRYWVELLGGDLVLFVAEENLAQNNAIIKCLAFGIHLQLLARELPCVLSMTLNWGENLNSAYVVNTPTLYGNALHVTRSMIAFTEPFHFLISEKVEDRLAHSLFYSGSTGACDNLVESFDKAGLQSAYLNRIKSDSMYHLIKVSSQEFHNFYIVDPDGRLQVGNKLNPPDRATVDFRSSLRESDANQRLTDYLVEADEVVLVDITHDGLVDALREAFRRRNHVFWKTINIIFPNRTNIREFARKGVVSAKEFPQFEEVKRKVQIFFESQDAGLINQWGCLEYGDDLPFVGQRFIQKNGGLVRLGIIFTGEKLPEVPYFEIRQRTRTYEQFARVFDLILAGSASISEWDLFGRISTNEAGSHQFAYGGVVNRAKISLELKNTQGFSEFCFPVVLIMLYTESFGDFKSVIQERTPYNATSDIGTFSNISGRISTDDVHGPDSKGNYFTLTFDSSAIVATNKFNQYCGWSSGQILSDDIWKQAAVRELGEELGLEISLDRLQLMGSHYLQRDDGNLYFQIYSLLLQSDSTLNQHELDIIRQRRPYVSLRQFTFTELEGLWRQKKLNRLLQNKFLDVFVPIFSDLGIKDSPKTKSEVAMYIQAMKR